MARFASVSLIALAWALGGSHALAQEQEPAGPEVWADTQPATLGTAVNGDLVEGDSFTAEDGLMDRYVLELQAGTPVELIMRSDVFDTYIVAGFVGPNGWEEIGYDDDGLGEGLNSRLRFLASETGQYEIRARGFFAGGAGAYTLSFGEGEATAVVPAGSIVVGGTAQGELNDNDASEPSGYEGGGDFTYDAYRFSATAGQRLSIIARSEAFDTTVQVGSGSRWGMFQSLGFDDDGLGEGVNSRLYFTVPADGEYEVRVSSYSPDSTGAYTLELAERAPLPAPTPVAFGQSVQTRLEASDATGDDGMIYDGYALSLVAGQRIEARVSDAGFDPMMDLTMAGTDPMMGGLAFATPAGTNSSRLLFTAVDAGDYVLRIGSYDPAAVGDYTLVVNDRGPLPPPPPPGATTVGAEVTGDLADTDGVGADERFFDDYVMSARSGQRLSVTLRSAEYDTLVEIGRYGDGGAFEQIISDDDSAGDLDSRAIFTPDANGDYVVRVTSFSSGEIGPYTLTTRDLGPEPRPQALRLGRSVNGEITDRDGLSEDESPYDPYTFSLGEGERVEFIARSDAFDTLLGVARVTETGREFLAVDDDGLGEGTNSRLIFTAPESGDWELWVTGFDPAGRGAYTLSSQNIGPEPEAQPARFGETVSGELGTRDRLSADNTWYDSFRFSGEAGQRIRAEMRSEGLDTFLLLGQDAGEFGLTALAEDDDGLGEGTNSRLTFTLPAVGEYEIWATTYGPNETGAYELRIEDLGPAPQPGSLVVGSTVRGSLDEADGVDAYGSFYEDYRVRLAAGESIRIELTSNAFDTLIQAGRMVEGAFQQDAMDDDGLSDTNSRLDFTATEAGEYILRVRSYAGGQTGDYALSVEPAPAA